ncbi:SUMF1/EgtB/PvdO family nonheme iron enzyme [Flavisolibacter sp. BT320]|nr:SUMF1/EgtB/PvdO family nonheme iron enzyme [Flavisolibacter longurius]
MDFQTRYVFDPKKDLLGKGGFSKVYKANDVLLERTVALKFFTAKASEKYQVLNEIKKVIRFEHVNLCKYYDVALLSYKNVLDEPEQMEVGIMEYIDAGDIKTYIKKNPQYTDKLLIDILKGLAYLHRHGIVHRDLKPQNILVKIVEDEPIAKITDFGISKVVDAEEANSSALLGTIEYMAPEQFNPKKYGINARIATNMDLWSFGLLVYEVICHQSMFGSRSGGISAEQVMSNILSDIPFEKAESLPPKYREVVKRCLVKYAPDRVQNALLLIPLLSGEETFDKNLPNLQQDSSDKISTMVSGVLAEEEESEEGNTQTLLPPSEVTEQDTNIIVEPEEAETNVILIADEHKESLAEETDENQPFGDQYENTQALPQFAKTEIDERQVLEQVDVSEGQTQVLHKSIVKPIEENDYDTLWKKKLKETTSRNKEKKPVVKIVILSIAALLIFAIFVANPLMKSPSAPETTMPGPVTEQKPPPPSFKEPPVEPVAGGTFVMGERHGNSAANAHEVSLDSFELGKYEITVGQFRQFIEETNYVTTAERSQFSLVYTGTEWNRAKVNWRYDTQGNPIDSTRDSLPVVHVSWTDANEYCRWLSNKTGKNYRLPTEAEWEYASKGGRGGEAFAFSGSNNIDEVAWYNDNAGGFVQKVGQKKPNQLSLYDMCGNASEWCDDFYDADYYTISPVNNPVNSTASNAKVARGGASGASKEYCTTTYRYGYNESTTGGNLGFRVCRVRN